MKGPNYFKPNLKKFIKIKLRGVLLPGAPKPRLLN